MAALSFHFAHSRQFRVSHLLWSPICCCWLLPAPGSESLSPNHIGHQTVQEAQPFRQLPRHRWLASLPFLCGGDFIQPKSSPSRWLRSPRILAPLPVVAYNVLHSESTLDKDSSARWGLVKLEIHALQIGQRGRRFEWHG